MGTEAKIAMMISVEREYRDRLRKIAAEQNLKDPSKVRTASGIVRDIVYEYLDQLNEGRIDPT